MFNTLLVEGNASIRQALSDILFSYFPLINVEEAGDGEDALSKVEYRRPDIIFMDIQLPGENGLEVTKEIKRIYKEIVIVILSTHALPEYRQQALRHGADCFLAMEEDTYMDDILARVEAEMAAKS
jgi:CheY-like chemotaxis protein